MTIKYDYNGRMYDIIPLDEMETGKIYRGKCRNAQYAIWMGEKFTHRRHKFGSIFLEEIDHPENEYHFDVFMPFEIAPVEEDEVRMLREDIDRKERGVLAYKNAVVKFNGGSGALLCNECYTIIAYGTNHEDKIHVCENCEVNNE